MAVVPIGQSESYWDFYFGTRRSNRTSLKVPIRIDLYNCCQPITIQLLLHHSVTDWSQSLEKDPYLTSNLNTQHGDLRHVGKHQVK